MPGTVDRLVLARMDARWEALEGRRHDQIGEAVEDHVDVDARGRLLSQVFFERPADTIALPDERFQVDTFLRGIDGGEHRIVQLAPVPVHLEEVLANPRLREMLVGKALRACTQLAPRGVGCQHGDDDRLQPDQDAEASQHQARRTAAAKPAPFHLKLQETPSLSRGVEWSVLLRAVRPRVIGIAIAATEHVAVSPGDALHDARAGLDVETATGTDGNAANVLAHFLAGSDNRFDHIPGLKATHLLLTHQVAAWEAGRRQARPLIAATSHAPNAQH